MEYPFFCCVGCEEDLDSSREAIRLVTPIITLCIPRILGKLVCVFVDLGGNE